MKSIITIFSCFLFSSALMAQKIEHKERVGLEDYRVRIQAIEDFTAPSEQIDKSIQEFKAEVANFKDPKLLKKDHVQLDELVKKATQMDTDVKSAAYFIETKRLRVEIKELEAQITEREKFLETQKLLKELESNSTYTGRLNRFIELTKASKHNLAKAMYFTLNAAEKGIADDFGKANTYLIQQKHMQDPLEIDITNKKKKVEEFLHYPEQSAKIIKTNQAELKKQKLVLKSLKDELKLDQFDIKFDLWSMGMFNCEKNAQYFRPVNNPNLLMLKHDGNLVSVLKQDPQYPKDFQIAYACKKKGSFGGCLDNEPKELCRLDSSCLESLGRMEAAYNRNAFFTELQSKLPHELLTQQQMNFRDQAKLNLIRVLAEEDKLGHFSQEDIYSMMNPIIEVAKTIVAKTPEEYLKKMKLEIDKNQKKMIASISKLAGPKPDATKVANSKRAVDYIFVSMTSELEKIINDDTLQARAFEDCKTPVAGREIFCEENAIWQERVKVFDDLHETKNLTPDECPRGVFRTPTPVELNCEPREFTDLEKTLQYIEKRFK